MWPGILSLLPEIFVLAVWRHAADPRPAASDGRSAQPRRPGLQIVIVQGNGSKQFVVGPSPVDAVPARKIEPVFPIEPEAE
jgi:hypothetical protein